MRFKSHYGILLVFFLLVAALKFGSFTGFQTAKYVEVGIDGISTFVFKDPLNWKSNDPLSFEVHFSNQGTIATINPVIMTVQLYDMHTGLIVAAPQSNSLPSLNQGQFQKFNFDFGLLAPKEYMLIVNLDNVDDTTPHNNQLMQQVIVSAPTGPVQIPNPPTTQQTTTVIPNPPTTTTPPTPTTLGPDPRVKNLLFAGIDPLNLKTNQYVGFDVLVENLGTTTTNPVYVTAQIKQGTTLIDQDLVTFPGIDAGKTATATFLLNPLNYGSYMLTITVDNVGDVNTANNIKQQRLEVPSGTVIPTVQIPNPPASTTTTGADLIVENIQINNFPANQLPQNQAFSAGITIFNQGNLDTSAGFDIDYAVFSSSTGIKFSSGVVSQPKKIPKGAREKSTINLAGLPAGAYTLRVTADFKGTSGDVNLANNEKVLNLIVLSQPSTGTVCNNNGYCDYFAGEGSTCADCTTLLSDCQTKYDHNELMATGSSVTFTSVAGSSSTVDLIDVDVPAKTALYGFNGVKQSNKGNTASKFSNNGEVLIVDVGTLLNTKYAFVCMKAAQQVGCNNDNVCDGNNGETQTNCPNDCDLGTNQAFCNSADFKEVLLSSSQKTSFKDASNANHEIQLAAVALGIKVSKIIYDTGSISLDLRKPQSTTDYEMVIPVMGKDPQGNEFAVACVKVKTTSTTTPPPIPVAGTCNTNGICEKSLGENLNNCQIDCSASPANLQFCTAGTSDFQDRIVVTEVRRFADSFQQVHTVKLVNVDKGAVQASLEYDGKPLMLDKGVTQQTNDYEIVVPFFYEELHPSIPQLKVLSAAICVKQKTKITTTTQTGTTTGTTPGTGTTPRPGTSLGTGTTPRPGTTGTQFYDITMLVKDKISGKPLKDAKINFYLYIKVTDDTGKAEFKSVPKESIKYKVVLSGYKSVEGEMNIDKSQQVNFELEPGAEITSPAATGIINEAQLIVGQYADPADIFTAELLKKTLSNNIVISKDGAPVLQLGVIPSAEKITSTVVLDNKANLFVPNTHSILVGGACVNQQTSVMLDNPPKCDSDVTPGQARIKLKTLHGGKNVILLIYGYTKEDTRLAAQALIRGLKETQTGTDFVITQNLGEIQVQKLG
ncbi:hypothetical protein HZA97_01315 [Candidatus Woesearchaeota archaeon]|nr:hypothetical protein [Candidatus Woesearchaeota archaeon]